MAVILSKCKYFSTKSVNLWCGSRSWSTSAIPGYARDISKKRRISNKIKGNAGEPMGQPPYGYMKDPDNPKRWIVDDEAALVVKRIYSMTLDGLGTEQIAAQLERDGLLTPAAYWIHNVR